MYIRRNLTFTMVYFFTWRLMLLSLITGLFALALYQWVGWQWVAIPWLPVSLIGTAVAFYVGFKNNQAYDRSWEARKIWGGITNLSRAFGSASRAFVTNEFAKEPVSDEKLKSEIKTLLYRHIAWMYALKHQMWRRTKWEHQRRVNAWYRDYIEKQFALVSAEDSLKPFLAEEELRYVLMCSNPAAQILDRQSQELKRLKREGLLDDFRQMELQKLITELYGEQGRSERIKNTPLPRQFATSSTIFIVIFTILLPFGMISEFQALGEGRIWLLVPFNMIVSWVFSCMEYIGDYSENPFEGLVNDVPLYTIVRNTEIDLREMMGEENLPEKIQAISDVLI